MGLELTMTFSVWRSLIKTIFNLSPQLIWNIDQKKSNFHQTEMSFVLSHFVFNAVYEILHNADLNYVLLISFSERN